MTIFPDEAGGSGGNGVPNVAPRFSASTMYRWVVEISLCPARRCTLTMSSPRTIDHVIPASRPGTEPETKLGGASNGEAGPVALGEGEVTSHEDRQLVVVEGSEHRQNEPLTVGALLHDAEQRQQRRFDRDVATLVRLGST